MEFSVKKYYWRELELLTESFSEENWRYLQIKERRPNREHRCDAGQISSESQVRTILTTLEC